MSKEERTKEAIGGAFGRFRYRLSQILGEDHPAFEAFDKELFKLFFRLMRDLKLKYEPIKESDSEEDVIARLKRAKDAMDAQKATKTQIADGDIDAFLDKIAERLVSRLQAMHEANEATEELAGSDDDVSLNCDTCPVKDECAQRDIDEDIEDDDEYDEDDDDDEDEDEEDGFVRNRISIVAEDGKVQKIKINGKLYSVKEDESPEK